MKIAMLTNNYKPFTGGVPISVERQAKELIKTGNQVTVFAPAYESIKIESESEKTSERVIRYRTSGRKMKDGTLYPFLISREILDVFAEESFDCIHVHHPMFVGPMALYLGRKYKLPVIYTYHTRYEEYLHYLPFFENLKDKGKFKNRIYRVSREWIVPRYMRWFTNQCDLVFAPTESIKIGMQQNGTKTECIVLPTGLEDSFFENQSRDAKDIRDKYKRNKRYLFCTVSRLEKEKNPEFFLKGIAELKQRLKDSFRVIYIGGGSMRETLEKMVCELGIQEEVIFVGNVENRKVKAYLEASDLFLYASKSETQGIVLAEAFAAGLPIVAVGASGINDIVMHKVNGYITSEDMEEWSERIVDALKENIYKKMRIEAANTSEKFRSSQLALYQVILYELCIRRKMEKHLPLVTYLPTFMAKGCTTDQKNVIF